MFAKKFFNHLASLPAISWATKLYLIIDIIIIVYLTDLHVTVTPSNINT